ncbi:uncharacterized protein ACRADG_001274 [Cochliomyia hominivorax]
MNTQVKFCLLLLFVVEGVYGVYHIAGAQNSPSIFTNSRLIPRDPVNSMACFSHYIEQSNEVGETYSLNYNQCLVNAKEGRQAIENEMVDKRLTILEISQGICQRLSNCDSLNSTLDVFSCHAKIGSNNTKAVYSISGNASEYANIMHEKYRVIDLRHEQCCKTAERNYVESTAANYRNLQDCLDGRIKPTTYEPITSTTTSAYTSRTTEAETVPDINVETTETVEPVENTAELGTEQFENLLKLFK